MLRLKRMRFVVNHDKDFTTVIALLERLRLYLFLRKVRLRSRLVSESEMRDKAKSKV